MEDRPKEAERHVTSVLAALSILDCFRNDSGLRLQDLHHRTGINKSRILRYVGTLEAAGMLHFDVRSRRYELGPKLFYLGRVIETHYAALLSVLHPVLDMLVAETGSVAYFSVRRGSDRLVLLRRSPATESETIVRNGQVRPLHLGANSRVLLAFEDEAERERLLRGIATVVDAPDFARLLQGIEDTRAKGYAIAFGETRRAHFVVSVPVLATQNALLGSLSLSSPTERDALKRAQAYVRILADAALAVAREAGP